MNSFKRRGAALGCESFESHIKFVSDTNTRMKFALHINAASEFPLTFTLDAVFKRESIDQDRSRSLRRRLRRIVRRGREREDIESSWILQSLRESNGERVNLDFAKKKIAFKQHPWREADGDAISERNARAVAFPTSDAKFEILHRETRESIKVDRSCVHGSAERSTQPRQDDGAQNARASEREERNSDEHKRAKEVAPTTAFAQW